MGRTVLVAYKNARIVKLIKEMLEDTGYSVTPVTDMHDALDLALSEPFDLIVVDRRFANRPEGIRFVEQLHEAGVRAPIISAAPEETWMSAPGSVAAPVGG